MPITLIRPALMKSVRIVLPQCVGDNVLENINVGPILLHEGCRPPKTGVINVFREVRVHHHREVRRVVLRTEEIPQLIHIRNVRVNDEQIRGRGVDQLRNRTTVAGQENPMAFCGKFPL